MPNLLTFLRFLLAPVCVGLLLQGSVRADWFALILFTVAALTDCGDGWIARRFNSSTPLGAFLDPLADKCMTLGVFVVFWVRGQIPLWPILVVAVRDLLVTSMRVYAVHGESGFATMWIAKCKTVLQFTALYLLFVVILWPATFWWSHLLALCCVYGMVVLSVYTGIRYLTRLVTA